MTQRCAVRRNGGDDVPRKPRKWPSYALWALEDVQALLLDIQALARDAQAAIQAGNRLESVIILGDVRDKARHGVSLLVRARAGEYREGGDALVAEKEEARRQPG